MNTPELQLREWMELDSLVRGLASKWARQHASWCHKVGDDKFFQRYNLLANAAEKSAHTFLNEWAVSIGDVLAAHDLAADVRRESANFRTPRSLIQYAMRATRSEIRHNPKIMRLAQDDRQFDDLNIALLPPVTLVIDHAVYALYVAWRPESRIVVPDNRPALLRAMAIDESFIRVVTPRQFEELVAFLYECLGCKVDLTPASRDFGADILAWHGGPMKSETLIAVQVKRYAANRKVGIKSLFELHGAVAHYRADSGTF
jgi:hypothetical protein